MVLIMSVSKTLSTCCWKIKKQNKRLVYKFGFSFCFAGQCPFIAQMVNHEFESYRGLIFWHFPVPHCHRMMTCELQLKKKYN